VGSLSLYPYNTYNLTHLHKVESDIPVLVSPMFLQTSSFISPVQAPRWHLNMLPYTCQQKISPREFYEQLPYQCNEEFHSEDFTPMDTHYCTFGILVVENFFTGGTNYPAPPPPESLHEAFSLLPYALQTLCGDIHFPSDDGKVIMDHRVQLMVTPKKCHQEEGRYMV
jgi:hypothetical protein